MKTFQNALTILLLGLASSRVNGKVNSCLQCESGPDGVDSGCVEGTSKGSFFTSLQIVPSIRVAMWRGHGGVLCVKIRWQSQCWWHGTGCHHVGPWLLQRKPNLARVLLEIHRDVDKWDLGDVVYTGRFDQSWWVTSLACFPLPTILPSLGAQQTTVTRWTLRTLPGLWCLPSPSSSQLSSLWQAPTCDPFIKSLTLKE